MKPRTVLESLAALSAEVLGPEPDRPALAYPESIPAGLGELRRVSLHVHVSLDVREPGHSDFADCRHWGINE
jgi:hypothetical protein